MRTIDCTDKSDAPRCNYCGATAPANGFDTKRVITRDFNHERRKQEVVTKLFTVCRGTACGMNLQMAHEG